MTRKLRASIAFIAVLFSTDTFATDAGYLWQAELKGQTRRCGVPQRIRFVMADAIIDGKIRFEGVTYNPRGRIETTLEMEMSLVRFYDDPKPLVSIKGRADGTWTGKWTSRRPGCAGPARIVAR